MNIIEAIDRMRAGAKIRRASSVGTTVSKCYLTLEEKTFYDQDGEILESEEVIYFNVEPVTLEKWIITTQAVKNKWAPQQSDLFANDFMEV